MQIDRTKKSEIIISQQWEYIPDFINISIGCRDNSGENFPERSISFI